jgi:hypothetical protein
MRRAGMCAITLVLGLSACSSRSSAPNAAHTPTVVTGGTLMNIPAPGREFAPLGRGYCDAMQLFVPDEHRLLCAFVLDSDLRRLNMGDTELRLRRYGLVQVPRDAEYTECGASDFAEVVDALHESFGELVTWSVDDVEEQLNERMRSLDLDEVRIGQPAQLGCFFSRPNACGFGMLVAMESGGETATIGVGAMVMRVNERLVFVYLYAQYEDEQTIAWLRKTSEQWSDAILKANRAYRPATASP